MSLYCPRAYLTASLVGLSIALLPGCHAETAGSDAVDKVLSTYHGGIREIVSLHCTTCHREGGSAPFSLENYSDVVARQRQVEAAVRSGAMPPWLADPRFGEWQNDRRLSPGDRDLILSWLENGLPEGSQESSVVAHTPTGSGDWAIGAPDAVLRLPDPVSIPAAGVIPYVYRYVRTTFEDDMWIQAIEIRPTAPDVMHHALVLVEEPIPDPPDTQPEPRRNDPREVGVGLDGFFAARVPGHRGVTYPSGQARLLPAGATLKFQLHYTPNGKATEDQTEIGFVFSKAPPTFGIETGVVANLTFVIPPGARRYEVTAVHRCPTSTKISGFLPHMHLRGMAFQYDLHYPDGNRETLLRVPHYDFNWQEEYLAAEPVDVPAGSWLRATGWFDNSRRNPSNPDPTQAVSFGEQTHEEMMNGYFHHLVRTLPEGGL